MRPNPRLLLVGLTFLSGCAFFLGPAKRDPVEMKVEASPQVLERGEYLANHVAVCVHCHSNRDFQRFSMVVKPGTEGGGGDCFDKSHGMPGTFCGANITSHPTTGLGAWSDGEVLRAVREGVDREGRTLFPMMPYASYRHMADEDAVAILAYLRALPPIENKVAEARYDFPVGNVVNFFPKPLEGPVTAPPHEDPVAYGKYLVELADCRTCHTPKSNMQNIEGMEFAGGFDMKMPGITRAVSANITPDEQTGIGKLTREDFIARFKSFDGQEAFEVTEAQQTPMPWSDYAGMTETDLGAIYDYLRTVKPIKNKVIQPGAPAQASAN
jgi:hypothetical protein